MRLEFKHLFIILLSTSLVLLTADFICDLAYSGHPPVWAEKVFGLVGVVFAGFAVLVMFVKGLQMCFSRIAKWGRIDSWGHFVPMFIFVMFFSVSVLLTFAYLVKWKYPSLQSRGEFGDSFGALNTFFSTAAFLALLISIAIQRRQMMDERERDKIEQDQKRRESWPAVVVINQYGYVYLYGVTSNGMPILKLQFVIILRNVSERPILNVFPMILFERFDSDGEFIESTAGGSVCIEPKGDASFEFYLTYAMSDFSDIDKLLNFLQIERRLICKTAFATAQRLYYLASQVSVINLMPLGDVRKDVEKFLSWARGNAGKDAKCKYDTTPFPYEYSFSVLPLTCNLQEISFEDFKLAVADGVAR